MSDDHAFNGSGPAQVMAVHRAKVPVVKMVTPSTFWGPDKRKCTVDISVNNLVALHNTRLLCTYTELVSEAANGGTGTQPGIVEHMPLSFPADSPPFLSRDSHWLDEMGLRPTARVWRNLSRRERFGLGRSKVIGLAY